MDGAADRLRPVLLTTLTTVLGLAPLLYESSSQAQFLKPTVITLTYGLGFGMVLVLIVVPALLSIGFDLRHNVVSARRAFRASHAGIQRASIAALTAMMVWLGMTLGIRAFTGALPSILGGSASVTLAFGLFAAGCIAIAFVVWAISLVSLKPKRV